MLFRSRSVVIRNRIVCSPMCQYVSDDGGPGEWQMVNFGRFAMGGSGIVFGEETAVEARGRKTHHCAGIYKDSHIADYRRINDFIKSLGSVPAIQLGHCGRKASAHGPLQDRAPLTEEDARVGLKPWQGLAPSALPAIPGGSLPHAMDRDDIRNNLADWREATQRSIDAGYDICEIHGAHGYLIHQFLSPVSNQRTDGYGGSLEGRMRFALEVVDAVRAVWPADKPLFYRTSAIDGTGGEWGIDDTLALARELKAHGVDVVDCSSGGITGDGDLAALPRVPGYQVGFSREIKQEVGIATAAVGLITDPSHAEAVLRFARMHEFKRVGISQRTRCMERPVGVVHQLTRERIPSARIRRDGPRVRHADTPPYRPRAHARKPGWAVSLGFHGDAAGPRPDS